MNIRGLILGNINVQMGIASEQSPTTTSLSFTAALVSRDLPLLCEAALYLFGIHGTSTVARNSD